MMGEDAIGDVSLELDGSGGDEFGPRNGDGFLCIATDDANEDEEFEFEFEFEQ